jgi:hypothetical protein
LPLTICCPLSTFCHSALDPKNALAKTQLDATQKLIRRVEFEKAIDAGEQKSAVERVREIIAEGNTELPSDYTGPRLATGDDGTVKMTQEFIDKMIEYFKNGKTLPRRVVWDIVLAVYDLVRAEPTLNEAVIENGVTCDVIGDVHGQFYDVLHLLSLTGTPSTSHALLFNGARRCRSSLIDRANVVGRRLCGQRQLVDGSHLNAFCLQVYVLTLADDQRCGLRPYRRVMASTHVLEPRQPRDGSDEQGA